MQQPIPWYFDVISPYAYLALPALDRMAKRRPVVMKPVVFGAILKHWGQLGPAEIAPKRVHIYRQCAFMAQQSGLAFRLPPQHPFPPLPILRLLTALDGNPAAVRRAFHLVWGEGCDATAPETLDRVAAAADEPEAVARIGSEAIKTKLHANTAEAIANGAFGVPTLVIDGEVFWGVDAMPMAEAFLDNPALFAGGEYRRIADVPIGVNRLARKPAATD